MEERILVVPRKKLFEDIFEADGPQGFGTSCLQQMLERIRDFHEFADRKKAEENPSLKQVIPYVVVCCGEKVFLMRRFANQDEARLRNLYSLGVGGHINEDADAHNADVLAAALERELREEINLVGEFSTRLAGYINDDSNPVGQVHFGLAYRAAVDSECVEVREKEIMSGSFVSVKEAQLVYPQMETWSQLVLKNIDAFMQPAGY